MFTSLKFLVGFVQNAPERRREQALAEAKAGGRYPLWYRALRVLLPLALVALLFVLFWQRLT